MPTYSFICFYFLEPDALPLTFFWEDVVADGDSYLYEERREDELRGWYCMQCYENGEHMWSTSEQCLVTTIRGW